MSECVVRMEKPENCLKCPLRNQCEIFCDWFGRFGTSVTRNPYPKPFDKGCRIVCQLPEGHGRLIDADAIPRFASGGVYTAYHFIEAIADTPTIVPAEAERSGE